MFSFETDEEQLEMLKVDTSILLLTKLLSRARKIGGPGGTAREFEKARLDTADKTQEAFTTLLGQRQQDFLVGAVKVETLEQANLLECLARKEGKETALDCSNLVSSADELIEVTSLQLTYNQELKKMISEKIDRIQIRAPIGGKVDLIQTRSGWVSRGDILASME